MLNVNRPRGIMGYKNADQKDSGAIMGELGGSGLGKHRAVDKSLGNHGPEE